MHIVLCSFFPESGVWQVSVAHAFSLHTVSNGIIVEIYFGFPPVARFI